MDGRPPRTEDKSKEEDKVKKHRSSESQERDDKGKGKGKGKTRKPVKKLRDWDSSETMRVMAKLLLQSRQELREITGIVMSGYIIKVDTPMAEQMNEARIDYNQEVQANPAHTHSDPRRFKSSSACWTG